MENQSRNIRVLVVDDFPTWRSYAARILRKMGYHVETAENYAQAEALIREEEYQLILADIRLVDENPSDTSGISLLALAKSKQHKPKVILMTAYSDSIARARTFREPAPDALILKVSRDGPSDLQKVRDIVHSVMSDTHQD